MRSVEDQIKELELEVEQVQQEADLYRKAAVDCMQELCWCMGYFAGVRQPHIARALAVNVVLIRRHLLQRGAVVLPTSNE